MKIGMGCRDSAYHGGMEADGMIEGVLSATHYYCKVESGSAAYCIGGR